MLVLWSYIFEWDEDMNNQTRLANIFSLSETNRLLSLLSVQYPCYLWARPWPPSPSRPGSTFTRPPRPPRAADTRGTSSSAWNRDDAVTDIGHSTALFRRVTEYISALWKEVNQLFFWNLNAAIKKLIGIWLIKYCWASWPGLVGAEEGRNLDRLRAVTW